MRKKDHIRDLEIADVEVGGDVHRIILSGIKNPLTTCALSSRDKIFREYDELRRLLITYPYGNEDMCADLVFDSDHADAAHGYVIMESMGYPYYSGSNTIATVAALLEYEIVPIVEGVSDIMLESPGGLVKAQYNIEDGRIKEVTVNGGTAFVISGNNELDVPGYGRVEYDLVWSGAYFVLVDAEKLDISLDKNGLREMKSAGYAITETIKETFNYEHPDYGRIASPGFVHFMGPYEKQSDKHYKGYGATYGYPQTVYYCPTGTGTSARMALLALRGEIEEDAVFENISAMGNKFTGRGLGIKSTGNSKSLATTITARPFVLATTRIHMDFDNPLMADFKKLEDIMT